MYLTLRNVAATIVCALVTISIHAVGADHKTLDVRKLQMVKSVLEIEGSNQSLEPYVHAASRAGALLGIQSDCSASTPFIELEFSETPLYSISQAADGSHAEVHLYNMIVVPDMNHMVINGGSTIASIQAELSDIEPQFVSTLNVGLLKQTTIKTSIQGHTLRLEFVPYSDSRETAELSQALLLAPQIGITRLNELVNRMSGELSTHKDMCGDALYRSIQLMEKAKMELLEAELSLIMPATDSKSDMLLEDLHTDLEMREKAVKTIASKFQSIVDRFEHERVVAKEAINSLLQSVELAKNDLTAQVVSMKSQYAEMNERIDAALDTAKTNQKQLLEKLNQVYENLTTEMEASEHLVTRISHFTDKNLSNSVRESKQSSLDNLDTHFSTLRSEDTAQAALNASADMAAPVLDDFSAVLPLEEKESVAVLAAHDASSSGTSDIAPPGKRVRPSRNSLTIHNIERPKKLAMLDAEDDLLKQAEENGILVVAQDSGPIVDVNTKAFVQKKRNPREPRNLVISKKKSTRPQYSLYNENVAPKDDPLQQLVDIDFQEMDLSNVVKLLGEKAQINIMAGETLSGNISANFKSIPLGRAIELVLRMEGLGIIEEAGVYRITTYEEAIASRRDTQMIFLRNAQAGPVKLTLDDVIAAGGGGDDTLVTVAANEETNVVIISGPREFVDELSLVVSELDITEPVIPTVTKAFKLNYSDPIEVELILGEILTENGQVSVDTRSRQVIVTDIPVKVAEIDGIIKAVDLPVKQVNIEAMIVDALLSDAAETGIDWLVNSNHFNEFVDPNESEADDASTFLPGAAAQTVLGNIFTGGGLMTFSGISDDVNFNATIHAQIESNNADLLANPNIVTVENKPAIIKITREFPYQKLTQTDAGAQIASTEFKEVGTILEVTPRVTHDQHILADIIAKESTVIGQSEDNIPIEALREAATTLRLQNNQTVYIGGLRKNELSHTDRKVPILGDIPGLGVLFKSKENVETNTELMIFLTCTILPDSTPELTPYEQEQFELLGGTPMKPNGSKDLTKGFFEKDQMRDPYYKWKRAE